MLCSFKRLIYPKNPDADSSGFMIGIYNIHEKLIDGKGNNITDVKVVGYYLPLVESIQVDMTGRWAKTEKHGTQF